MVSPAQPQINYLVVGINDREVKSHMPIRRPEHRIYAIHTDAAWSADRLRGMRITDNDLVTFVGRWREGRHAEEIMHMLRQRGWRGHLLPEVTNFDGRP